MSKIEAGVYKGRGVEGSVQHGHAKTGTEQMAIDIEVPALGRQLTTFLPFTEAATPYSTGRLRALGWDGSDDPRCPGISKNEIDVQVKYETYNGAEQMKVEIMTGSGGKAVMSAPMTAQETRGFMSRIAKSEKPAAAPAAGTPASAGKFAL